MMQYKKNYNLLLIMRVLKSILTIFIDSFLILYFMQLSNNNILPVGLFKLFEYTFVMLTIFLVRNLLKNNKRIYLLRIGVFLNLVFFVLLFILNKKASDFSWLLGIILGLEEGMYFSVFNIYESKIKSSSFARYSGMYTAINSLISILIPFIFGSVMSFKGFDKCLILIFILVLIKIIISFIYQDTNIPKEDKANLREYIKIIKTNKHVLLSHLTSFTNGLTYSGAFNQLITIYIIRVFKTGFQLGIFTSFFAIITSFSSFLFAHFIKKKRYVSLIKISNLLTIIGLIFMVLNCNFYSIILFNFIQSFAKTYSSLINEGNFMITSNLDIIKNHYKEEYFLNHEFFLYIGRSISYIVFCALAFLTNTLYVNIIMIIFILFIILRSILSVALQKKNS